LASADKSCCSINLAVCRHEHYIEHPTDPVNNNPFPTMGSAFIMTLPLLQIRLDFAVRCQISTGAEK
jgi:hypothetical protein